MAASATEHAHERISAAPHFFVKDLSDTSASVWAILATLLLIGGLRPREQTLSRATVLVTTARLAGLALASLLADFRFHWVTWLAWLAGSIAVYTLVGGSVEALLATLSMLIVFYALNVALALHPDWKQDGRLALAAGIICGILPGLLLARAYAIFASARARAG